MLAHHPQKLCARIKSHLRLSTLQSEINLKKTAMIEELYEVSLCRSPVL